MYLFAVSNHEFILLLQSFTSFVKCEPRKEVWTPCSRRSFSAEMTGQANLRKIPNKTHLNAPDLNPQVSTLKFRLGTLTAWVPGRPAPFAPREKSPHRSEPQSQTVHFEGDMCPRRNRDRDSETREERVLQCAHVEHDFTPGGETEGIPCTKAGSEPHGTRQIYKLSEEKMWR